MTVKEVFKTSLTALTLNKIRSLLTMLGVIIGVFSVVALVSVVKGFQNYITDQFNSLGSNLLYVMPGKITIGGNGGGGQHFTENKLSYTNIDTLQTYLSDSLAGISAQIETSKNIEYKTKKYQSTIMGGNASMGEILNLQINQGRFYTKSERDAKAKVVILGKTVLDELFPTKNPIGENVKISGISFLVIGTLKSKGPAMDAAVYIPDTTTKNSLGVDKFTSIMLKAKEGADIDQIMSEVKLALRRDLKEDDFTVFTQKEILSSINDILNVLSIGLAAIAGISLFVGGIGIMNIMLVSVTERTREIGLRKALGATSKDIALQFITESVALSVVGGLIGLILAWAATLGIQSLLRAEVPWWAAVLAFGFSLIVGVVFGTYPAINAAKKDPIEALRYE